MKDDNLNINDNNDEYEVFDMGAVKPLNDPDCSHYFVEEPHEEIDGYKAWTCIHCRRGKFFPKGTKIINN